MEFMILIAGGLVFAGLWHVGEQLKGRNIVEAARLEFEAKKFGWSDTQLNEFMMPKVVRFMRRSAK